MTLAFVIIAFLVISILLSSAGLGGGAFYVPLLLALGFKFSVASSTSLFLITLTGFSAFSRFQQVKLVDWKLALVMDLFTDIGAFVGGYTAWQFDTSYLKMVFGGLLILAAFFVFKMQGRQNSTRVVKRGWGYWHRVFGEFEYSIYVPAILPITFAIGYLSGALGVAGGLLKIPIMILWFRVPAKVTVATSSLMVGLTGLLGFTGHVLTGEINWLLSLSIGLIVILGGQIGAHFSIRLSERKLKRILAIVFLLISVWMIVNN